MSKQKPRRLHALPTAGLLRFVKMESSGGIVLIVAAALALVVANIPGLGHLYDRVLHLPVVLKLGPLGLEKDVLHMINDGLMAIFFLLVALEIKREMLEGDLSQRGQLILPGVAALGGIAVPALIYSTLNWGDAVRIQGWAIPAATDIAFSLGVLALLGTRAPVSLKIFLTTVAVLDDLAAIVIIAAFYTQRLSILALGLGLAGLVVLIILNRSRVHSLTPYWVVGIIMWFCVLKSGVHATLAGVAMGFCIPLRTNSEQQHSPLHVLEEKLHPWVAFGILPLFAFANAGVNFAGTSLAVLGDPVTLGILFGLAVGKPLGIFAAILLAVKTGLASLPREAAWSSLLGVATLCGIGFTMSLFIGTLAFPAIDMDLLVALRVGVFGGSLISALLGWWLLHFSLPKKGSKFQE